MQVRCSIKQGSVLHASTHLDADLVLVCRVCVIDDVLVTVGPSTVGVGHVGMEWATLELSRCADVALQKEGQSNKSSVVSLWCQLLWSFNVLEECCVSCSPGLLSVAGGCSKLCAGAPCIPVYHSSLAHSNSNQGTCSRHLLSWQQPQTYVLRMLWQLSLEAVCPASIATIQIR